jgi:hypothetical protein
VIHRDELEGEETRQVRIHRNNIVHVRIDVHAAAVAFADSRSSLLMYLGKLPEAWG